MTLIIPNQDFKHEGWDFLKGEQYHVSDEDAAYFSAAGWTGDRGKPATHALEVQDLQLGIVSNVH